MTPLDVPLVVESGPQPSWETLTVTVGLLASMAAYAVFAGADFGGGIWDLLAGSSESGRRARDAIDASVTPVWEGNQVWIVLGLVLLWTEFPAAFSAITVALFVPLAISLLGIVLRGVGFAFRHETTRPATKQLTGILFATSSVLAPFFLGASVGAVTTGSVRPDASGTVTTAWTSATAIVTGALFVAACAFIGAVFLVGDSSHRGADQLVRYFSHRAAIGGSVTGLLAVLNLALLHSSAPYVFARLTGVALPLVVVSLVAGGTAMVVILLRRQWLLRVFGALAVAAVIAAWGVAQYPWLLPGSLSLVDASAPPASQLAEIVVMLMALLLVLPSFAYLYWLQQHGCLEHDSASEQLRRAARIQDGVPPTEGADRSTAPRGRAGWALVVLAVLLFVARRRDRREARARGSSSSTGAPAWRPRRALSSDSPHSRVE